MILCKNHGIAADEEEMTGWGGSTRGGCGGEVVCCYANGGIVKDPYQTKFKSQATLSMSTHSSLLNSGKPVVSYEIINVPVLSFRSCIDLQTTIGFLQYRVAPAHAQS